MPSTTLARLGLAGGWVQETLIAVLALGLGFGLLPLLIYVAGSTSLGRYDNGNAARIYDTVYEGLRAGSAAALIVVFGPYALYLLFRVLRLWWRAGARAV